MRPSLALHQARTFKKISKNLTPVAVTGASIAITPAKAGLFRLCACLGRPTGIFSLAARRYQLEWNAATDIGLQAFLRADIR